MVAEDSSVSTTGSLTAWGWNSYFEAFWRGEDWKSTAPARVIAQRRKFWRLAGDFGECWAEASGKLRLAADEGGDWPAVVLNKADTCEDAREMATEIDRVAIGTEVCVVSAKTGQGFGELGEFLRPRNTLVLLGSSGVGKSTIANRLLGQVVQEVGPVRGSDSRGRHTTTSRELFALPGGALLMDTPGLRAMQLWDAEDGVAQTFADIDGLAAQCRFGDCRHEGEPGCGVQAALSAGTLDPARLENRRKLMREQEFLRRKVDPEARQDWKNRVKSLHQEVKRMYESRKKDGKE